VIENMARDFYKKIGEACNEIFTPKLKGIIIGGPGPTKRDFVDGNYLSTELKGKITTILDIGYADEYGLEVLVDKASDVLREADFAKEKELVQEFLREATTGDLAAYGMQEVKKFMELGAVETLLLSEKLDPGVIEQLIGKAEKTGIRVEIISVDTREGQQLAELGGIAALLRFRPK
jgi:peptide chain release factor subunit 1